jgi:hypothetical protein
MKRLTYLVLFIMLGAIAFQGLKTCREINNRGIDTVRVIDTIWQKHDTVIYRKLKVTQTIHDTVAYNKFLPDTNYAVLKKQYEDLVKLYASKNIYKDTFKIKEIKGLFVINDTVQFNKLQNRGISSKYELPTVKETVTITLPGKPGFYFGGGISISDPDKQASLPLQLNTLSTGLMYKTRKDKLFGVYMGISPSANLVYGFQTYWRLGK